MRFGIIACTIFVSSSFSEASGLWPSSAEEKKQKHIDKVGQGLESSHSKKYLMEKNATGDYVMKRLHFKSTKRLYDFFKKNKKHAKFLPYRHMAKLEKYWEREIGILSDAAQSVRNPNWGKDVETDVNAIIQYFDSLWTVGKWLSGDDTRSARIRALEMLFAAFKFIREREDELALTDVSGEGKATILNVFMQMVKNAQSLVISESDPTTLQSFDWAALVYDSGTLKIARGSEESYTDPAREFGPAMMELRAMCDVELKIGCDDRFLAIADAVHNGGQANGITVSEARLFIMAYHRADIEELAQHENLKQVFDWLKTGAPVDQTPIVLKPCHSTPVKPEKRAKASSKVEVPRKTQVAKPVPEDEDDDGLEGAHVVAKNGNRLPTLRATEAKKQRRGGSSGSFLGALTDIARVFGR